MSKTELNHVIEMVIGDWSHDGHNMTETVMIKSNVSAAALEKAHLEGCKIIGFNLTNDVANDYEENYMFESELDKLLAAGFDKSKLDIQEDDAGENQAYLDSEMWLDIYMFFAQKGDPKIEWKRSTRGHTLHIGGYGLFSS